MNSTIVILNTELEYDFLSAWLKYTRITNGISQEALSYGVCSISHLSYFENGKKRLRKEVIETLLKKLNIEKIDNLANIGLMRQRLNTMMNNIESYNYEGATIIYDELLKMESIINQSPYSIEFKIYQLMYKSFVEDIDYNQLKDDITLLSKVFHSLNNNLKYLYLFVSGNILYRHHLNEEGIDHLKQALILKDTSWVNFILGRALCFNENPAKGSYYLEKALDNYEKSGRYLNAVWCHNYLGVCFSYLRIYDNALKHFNAALMSAKHFDMDTLFYHLYINLSDFYLSNNKYEESIKWSKIAMENYNEGILPVYNYISASIKLGNLEQCDIVFQKYLTDHYKSYKYYNAIYFLYLAVYRFNDDYFYHEVKTTILPYYEKVRKTDICRDIKLKLIDFLESKRRYKEANKLYKELI
ncbi:MAG: hypothetical protein ACERKN_13560 [Velocimicrobium sp.]